VIKLLLILESHSFEELNQFLELNLLSSELNKPTKLLGKNGLIKEIQEKELKEHKMLKMLKKHDSIFKTHLC
jgi:hypothetical protein